MKQSEQTYRYQERGFGTVTISMIILLLLTLVTLYTAKTTMTEQQISSDQYRSDQALSAANAALDYAIAYYNSGGLDHDDDGNLDYTSVFPAYVSIVDAGGELAVESEVYFSDLTTETVTINSIGHSDDQSALRRISIKVTDVGLFGKGDGGPDYPLISRDATAISGNVTVINRYTHKGVWTGADETNWGSGGTFVAHPDEAAWTREKRIDPNEQSAWTMEASKKSTGINSDVISNDPNLGNLSPDEFFRNFLVEDKVTMARLASNEDQRYSASTYNWNQVAAKTPKGVVWIDGDWSPAGNFSTIGSEADPVLLILDGNFTSTGTGGSCKNTSDVNLFGIFYIIGTWTPKGNLCIQGGVIVEGDLVDSHGSPKIIYDPKLFEGGNGDVPFGAAGVVAGTWKDWAN